MQMKLVKIRRQLIVVEEEYKQIKAALVVNVQYGARWAKYCEDLEDHFL